MTENIFKNCILCGGDQLMKLEKFSKDHLVKCSHCGFVFSNRIPSQSELIDFYSRYPISEEISPITALRYNEWLDQFEKYRSTNNILDVGCGNGFFLQQAKARGWNVYGTEFTSRQVEMSTAKGINMHLGVLDINNYQPGFFDVITSIEVIEHINNPNEEINKFNTICRKGGVVYITTPNFNALSRYYLKNQWNIFAFPEHLCYYTRQTLCKLFEQHGFKTQSFISTGISLTRFQQSSSNDKSKVINSDEVVRQQAESKMLFRIAKSIVNTMLTVTNKGDTLKGLFLKQ